MSTPASRLGLLDRRQRLAALAAALTVATSLAGAMVLGFHGASHDRWLLPTPELMAMVSACAQQPTRELRKLCQQQGVAEHLAQHKQPLRLAQR